MYPLSLYIYIYIYTYPAPTWAARQAGRRRTTKHGFHSPDTLGFQRVKQVEEEEDE